MYRKEERCWESKRRCWRYRAREAGLHLCIPQATRKHNLSHLPHPDWCSFLHSLPLHFHNAYEDRIGTKVQLTEEEDDRGTEGTWQTENGQHRGHQCIRNLWQCTGIVATGTVSETSNEVTFGKKVPINQTLLSSDTWKGCPSPAAVYFQRISKA